MKFNESRVGRDQMRPMRAREPQRRHSMFLLTCHPAVSKRLKIFYDDINIGGHAPESGYAGCTAGGSNSDSDPMAEALKSNMSRPKFVSHLKYSKNLIHDSQVLSVHLRIPFDTAGWELKMFILVQNGLLMASVWPSIFSVPLGSHGSP